MELEFPQFPLKFAEFLLQFQPHTIREMSVNLVQGMAAAKVKPNRLTCEWPRSFEITKYFLPFFELRKIHNYLPRNPRFLFSLVLAVDIFFFTYRDYMHRLLDRAL